MIEKGVTMGSLSSPNVTQENPGAPWAPKAGDLYLSSSYFEWEDGYAEPIFGPRPTGLDEVATVVAAGIAKATGRQTARYVIAEPQMADFLAAMDRTAKVPKLCKSVRPKA